MKINIVIPVKTLVQQKKQGRTTFAGLLILLLAPVLFLSGCTTTQRRAEGEYRIATYDATGEKWQTLVYSCEAEDLRIVVRQQEEKAVVFLPGETVFLPRVESASGVKFSDGQTVFWSKGEEALLEWNGKLYSECRVQPREAVWEEARFRGVDFRAVGNEPGWYLEIINGDRIIFVTDYGRSAYVFPAPMPHIDRKIGRIRYQTATKQNLLMVTIEDRPCVDSMSGERFEATVTLKFDGHELRGCGRGYGVF
jgi:membrane-bound inhibitor of C-type lysozyme/uncharacterized membrane protein